MDFQANFAAICWFDKVPSEHLKGNRSVELLNLKKLNYIATYLKDMLCLQKGGWINADTDTE